MRINTKWCLGWGTAGAILLSACALPIGPKRTFSDWEDATPLPRSAETSAVAPAATMTPLTIAVPSATQVVTAVAGDTNNPTPAVFETATETASLATAVAPDNTDAINQTTDGVDMEYDYPPPMAFTPGAAATEFGVQINGCDKDVASALKLAKSMGMTWIKQQARWSDIEKGPGVFDWSCLDKVIPAAHNNGFKMLISVTSAPAFTRQIYGGVFKAGGRPADFTHFGLFIAHLIQHYKGQIQAIEMWNEPNLIREWGDALSGSVYGRLLAVGYGVTKFMDSSIMVISAGVAPTGFNAEWEAMDDVGFLGRLLEYDGASYMDCLGAHANGPDGLGDIQSIAPRYFDLAAQQKPICVTEFGYALPVEGRTPKGFDWAMAHTEEQQVKVLTEGIQWARSTGYVNLVILWNLDFDGPHTDPNAPYALMRKGWESPAIAAITGMLGGKK